MKLTPILAAIAAASGSVLALTHLGANPVVPGKDLGVSHSVSSDGATILFESDAGDLDAVVRLNITPPFASSYTAHLTSGPSLGLTVVPSGGTLLVTVHKADGSVTDKFLWPAPAKIRITRAAAAGSPGPLAVQDWQIFPKDSESESQSKATQRKIWWWTSTVLLLLSAAVTAIFVYQERTKAAKPSAHGAKDCVEALIEEIEVENDEELTRHIRTFLRKRIQQQASYAEAKDALGLPPGQSAKVIGKALTVLPGPACGTHR